MTNDRHGRTVIEVLFEELWKELDTVVELIMSEGEPEVWTDEDGEVRCSQADPPDGLAAVQKYGEWRGQAQGYAYALAVLTNPYKPDIEAIRTEAMERYEKGEEDDE
jgi:hypothetical protein